MQITQKGSSKEKEKKKIFTNNLSLQIKIFSLVLFAFCLSFFVYKITVDYFPSGIKPWIIEKANGYGFRQLNYSTSFWDALKKAPKHIAGHTEIPHLYIDIKFKHLSKLKNKRDGALQVGILEKSGNDFVPAEIRFKNRTIMAKLRLKGDWTDHLEGKKWSFRIHIKGKDQLFGLRRFSIQHPKTRGFQSEILFFETLRKYGVLAPRYKFVKVTVNGDSIGIMAIEEHFSKELLEYNGRREGVIIRYDESLVWKATDGPDRGFGGAFDNYLNAKIDAFGSGKIRKSIRLNRENAIATSLLRSFASNDLDASEVFDAEQLANFLAVSEFFRSSHAIRWHNLRFYFNPISMKLEPIGFDGDINHPSFYPMPLAEKEPIVNKLLADPVIRKLYQKTLNTIIEDFNSGELVNFLKDIEKIPLLQLRKEFFFLDNFDYGILERSVNLIASNYRNPKLKSSTYPVLLHAFLFNEKDKNYVEITNVLPLPVEITSINWKDNTGNLIEFRPNGELVLPIVLEPNLSLQYIPPLRLNFHAPPNINKITLEIVANIQGTDISDKTIAEPYHPVSKTPLLATMDLTELLNLHPFLSVTGENIIAVKKGEWRVNNNIIVPKNYSLVIPAGTVLRFNEISGLISYGPIICNGETNNPIVFTGISTQGSDNDGYWQGVVVFKANGRSFLHYTQIKNTAGINQNKWSLTAGTTFYKSDVKMDNCILLNNKCEDALNIIHSKFSLTNITVKNCSSDAFDSDFSNGELINGYFQDIGLLGGGDGVDTSGSIVDLKNSHFIRVSDKAISIGEKSTFTGENITIEESGVGIVSKDKSTVNIHNTVIKNCKIASLMAYVKKPEYGPSQLIGNNIAISGEAKIAIAQDESEILLNGNTIETESVNVEDLYDTVMKPGIKK